MYDKSPLFTLNKANEERHIPILHFIGTLYFINVQADFVLDIRRWMAPVWLEVLKDNTGPVCFILQKFQCFFHQMGFSGSRLKFIQV